MIEHSLRRSSFDPVVTNFTVQPFQTGIIVSRCGPLSDDEYDVFDPDRINWDD